METTYLYNIPLPKIYKILGVELKAALPSIKWSTGELFEGLRPYESTYRSIMAE